MTDEIIAFQGNQIKVTKGEYDTFVAAIAAQNATPAEIKLYLYDCDRRGVHPLDKLIHFTKRSGRYAPVISIDYMRIRAESSGAYVGSDDAVFDEGDEKAKYPKSAKVTVWKSVEGRNGRFEATARWSEYAPEDISSGSAFMWRKMPHTMLAKCAEALALRKAFPGQLAGLYAAEEMAQDGRYLELPAQAVGAPEQSTVDVGDQHGDTSGEGKSEIIKAAEDLAGAYTAKQILDKPSLVKDLVELSGQTTQAVCKFLGGLEKGKKYTMGEIAKLMNPEKE